MDLGKLCQHNREVAARRTAGAVGGEEDGRGCWRMSSCTVQEVEVPLSGYCCPAELATATLEGSAALEVRKHWGRLSCVSVMFAAEWGDAFRGLCRFCAPLLQLGQGSRVYGRCLVSVQYCMGNSAI